MIWLERLKRWADEPATITDFAIALWIVVLGLVLGLMWLLGIIL